VWIGDVLIRAAAEGNEHLRADRNLVLTDGRARRLGAQPGDRDRRYRGAGHASATGRFDDEQLFLPAGQGHPGGAGATAGRARFFHEVLQKHRGARGAGSAWRPRSRRAAAVGDVTMLRACSLADLEDGKPFPVEAGGHADRAGAPGRGGARAARRVHARRDRSAEGELTRKAWSAGCTGRASTCAPAHRPRRPPPSRWPSTR